MAYFPLYINLINKKVLVVGSGTQIQEKIEKLLPFDAHILQVNKMTDKELLKDVAIVIVGDMTFEEAETICQMCREEKIPVNVVDKPALCDFYFPAIITQGDLTVSISTGGKSPYIASYIKNKIHENIPDSVDEIIDWVSESRSYLKEKGILKQAVHEAFLKNRPLTKEECEAIEK